MNSDELIRQQYIEELEAENARLRNKSDELVAVLNEVIEGYEAPEYEQFDWPAWYDRAIEVHASLEQNSRPRQWGYGRAP